ncbi:MAG: carbohydrate kinase [Pseudomonadota bacterium]
MILCCGEALVDMLPRETPGGENAFAPFAGGAVFNTAIALGRLGAPASFFSGISTDLFGRLLQDALAESRVDTSLVKTSDRPTTLAFVTLTNGQASYAFYDENTAGRMLDPTDVPVLPDDVNAVFFGGISLVVEPCARAYESLMLAEAGRRVLMLDPNVRPGFIRDEAAYRARIERMIAAADILKVSDEDLAWLSGAGSLSDGAATMLKKGPALVLVTEGAKGAHGFTESLSVEVPARAVEVVDTVGAGDTFNAGVLAALDLHGHLTRDGLRRLDEAAVRQAISLGSRAAAVTVSRAGANPPWAREL